MLAAKHKLLPILNRFAICLLLFTTFGCTSSNIVVYQKFDHNEQYKNYLIFVATANFSVEKVIEDQLVDLFKKNNVNSLAKYRLISAPQSIDESQFYRLMRENNIDGIIVIRPIGEVQNFPETPSPVPANAYHLYQREATYLYESSDEWFRRNQKLIVQIIDVNRNRIVWYAFLTIKNWTITEVELFSKTTRSNASEVGSLILSYLRNRE